MFNTSGSDIDLEEFECGSGSRKVAKTYVEKKRRDRINRSLDELKDLLAINCDRARYQKLEKAEILEMCVEFVKHTNKRVHSMKRNYEIGYQRCTNDVATFLASAPEVNSIERQQLLTQLSTTNNRRFQPYAQPTVDSSSIVTDWFSRCGSKVTSPNKSLHDSSSSSERSTTSSPLSSLDSGERCSSLWRPW